MGEENEGERRKEKGERKKRKRLKKEDREGGRNTERH